MSLPSSYTYRSAFVSGLSYGFILPFSGCLAATFFSLSVVFVIVIVLALSLAGGIVLGLARRSSEREEWNELNRQAVREEFDKEQRIIDKIGIPDRILGPMRQEMTEEQQRHLDELPTSLPVYNSYKAGVCHFAGYFTSGIVTALFLYISDMHLVISGVMLLGVKFTAELYMNITVRKAVYPVRRTLLNISLTALMFVILYMLLKAIMLKG